MPASPWTSFVWALTSLSFLLTAMTKVTAPATVIARLSLGSSRWSRATDNGCSMMCLNPQKPDGHTTLVSSADGQPDVRHCCEPRKPGGPPSLTSLRNCEHTTFVAPTVSFLS